MVVSGFAGLTFLTKNSFLDQINQQYVMTAKAKGTYLKVKFYMVMYSETPCLIVIAGFPSAFIGILFSSSLFIEVIFSSRWSRIT